MSITSRNPDDGIAIHGKLREGRGRESADDTKALRALRAFEGDGMFSIAGEGTRQPVASLHPFG